MIHFINAVWILVGIYWAVGVVGAKPTVKRQSTLSSALHLAILCAAGLLVWAADATTVPRRRISSRPALRSFIRSKI